MTTVNYFMTRAVKSDIHGAAATRLSTEQLRGPQFAHDSPLEGGVSCELVSENAKFPASRENTGNFIDSGLGGASEAAKKGMKSVSYGPIPYAS
jgi:hypothetical protein